MSSSKGVAGWIVPMLYFVIVLSIFTLSRSNADFNSQYPSWTSMQITPIQGRAASMMFAARFVEAELNNESNKRNIVNFHPYPPIQIPQPNPHLSQMCKEILLRLGNSSHVSFPNQTYDLQFLKLLSTNLILLRINNYITRVKKGQAVYIDNLSVHLKELIIPLSLTQKIFFYHFPLSPNWLSSSERSLIKADLLICRENRNSVSSQELKPDLIIDSLSIVPSSPTLNDTICVYATVKNIGQREVNQRSIFVETFVNGHVFGKTYFGKSLQPGQRIKKKLFCSSPLSSNQFGIPLFFIGENVIKTLVDPPNENKIEESNESNNEKLRKFNLVIPSSNNKLFTCFDSGSSFSTVPSTSGTFKGRIMLYSPCTVSSVMRKAVSGNAAKVSAWSITEPSTGKQVLKLKKNKEYYITVRLDSHTQFFYNTTIINNTFGKLEFVSFIDINGYSHKNWIPVLSLLSTVKCDSNNLTYITIKNISLVPPNPSANDSINLTAIAEDKKYPISLCEFSLDGNNFFDEMIPEDGAYGEKKEWVVEDLGRLKEGSHFIRIRCKDNHNNSGKAYFRFNVTSSVVGSNSSENESLTDTTPPQITNILITPKKPTSNDSINVTAFVLDDESLISLCQFSLDNAPYEDMIAKDGMYDGKKEEVWINIGKLSEGTHHVRIKCIDDANNYNESLFELNVSPLEGECLDSDGGDKPEIPGRLIFVNNNYEDSCANSVLTEYFCSSNGPKNKTYTCNDYCQAHHGPDYKGRCSLNSFGIGFCNCTKEELVLKNKKDPSLYSPKEVFLVSDRDWKTVLSLVPLTTWTSNEDREWCQYGYETPKNVCVYPFLIYHIETYNTPSGESKQLFDADSIIYFLQQYSPDKLIVVGDLPEKLKDDLVATSPVGAEVNPEDIREITLSDLPEFWNSFNKVVYVKDDYKYALIASAFASLINAPLVIEDSSLDNEEILKNKNVICVGINKPVCDKEYTFTELQREYIKKTKTKKVIVVNPDDLDIWVKGDNSEMPCLDVKHGDPTLPFVCNTYGATSLGAPILASAKHELIIETNNKKYDLVDRDLENKIRDLFSDKLPEYLTIFASPNAVEMSFKDGFMPMVGNNFVSADSWKYSFLGNHEGDPDFAIGRIFGLTLSDVSSYLARDLFYDKTKKSRDTMLSARGEPAYGVGRDVYCIGKVLADVYDTSIKILSHDDSLSSSPYITHYLPPLWKEKTFINYMDHGGVSWAAFSSFLIPYLDNTLVMMNGCQLCDFREAKEFKNELFCAHLIRKGAIGVFAPTDVVMAIPPDWLDFGGTTNQFLATQLFTTNETIGKVFSYLRSVKGFSLCTLPGGAVCGAASISPWLTLIGDPTFKLNLHSFLPRPSLKLIKKINEKTRKYEVTLPIYKYKVPTELQGVCQNVLGVNPCTHSLPFPVNPLKGWISKNADFFFQNMDKIKDIRDPFGGVVGQDISVEDPKGIIKAVYIDKAISYMKFSIDKTKLKDGLNMVHFNMTVTFE